MEPQKYRLKPNANKIDEAHGDLQCWPSTDPAGDLEAFVGEKLIEVVAEDDQGRCTCLFIPDTGIGIFYVHRDCLEEVEG